MKTVILAGGLGVRIMEETVLKPKPMVEIGNMPILQHIMKIYDYWGHKDFVVCIGNKGYIIKEYFMNYYAHNYDVYIDFKVEDYYIMKNDQILPKVGEWKILLADTGETTQTGGRIKRLQSLGKTFMLTYGDGLTDVNINKIIDFHKSHGKIATVLAVVPQSKFGTLSFDKSGKVTDFQEKIGGTNYINGGFFVLEDKVLNYIEGDEDSLEYDILPKLVKDGQLMAYKYDGFWKCMDSLKDKEELQKMWVENNAPWKLWK